MKSGYQFIWTTFSDQEEAKRVSRILLERKLVACVTLLPGVTSLYEWEGKMQESSEVLAIYKTASDLYFKVEEAIVELHSYDTPEVVALDLDAGNPRYFAWLEKYLGAR